MKKSFYLLTFWAILVLMTFCLEGCSPISNFKKNQEDKRNAAEARKANYAALKTDISGNYVQKGTPVEALKVKYGAPDDIFYSGSSVSSFQVWTYNIYKDKLADKKLDSVILYIENDKLVNWKF